MKKKLLKIKNLCLVFLLTGTINVIQAQSFAQYALTDGSVTYAGLNKNNSTYLTNGDENTSAVIPIGFNFIYRGITYTDFSASSNGFIQLGTVPIYNFFAHYNDLISLDFNPIIAPFWDDLDATDSVWSRVTGNAPNRILTVEWKKVKWDYQAADSNFTFKLRLFETSNVITFFYGSAGVANLPSATIGMNYTGTNFLSLTPGTGGANPTLSIAVSDNSIADFPGNGGGYFYSFTPPVGDFAPPVVSLVNYSPSVVCSPVDVTVSATIDDAVSGVNAANLWYSVNGIFGSVPFTLISGDSLSGVYQGIIPAQAANSTFQFYIQSSDYAGNNGNSATTTFAYSTLSVSAGNDQTINTNTTATLNAVTTGLYDANIKISEVVLFRAGIGATPVYPAYIDITAQDFIEITNLNATAVNMGGYIIEVYEGTNLIFSYSLPATLDLDPNGVAVIHFGPGTDDLNNNYYNNWFTEDYFFSGSLAGFVIKNANGQVVDAVAANGYVFPSISGVTNSEWSGNVANSSGRSGILRAGLDDNTNVNWSVSDAGNEMTLAGLNPGLSANPITVSYLWSPGGATTASFTTPALASTTTYIITVSDGICSASDTVVVNVVTPSAPVAGFYTPTPNTYTLTNVSLLDTSLQIPNTWNWTITPTTFIYNSGSSAGSQNPVVRFLQPGLYTVSLKVTNASGMDSVTKVDYINVSLSYCTPTYLNGTLYGDYIKGVRLATLNNWPTINDSIAYHDYYNTYSTSLVAGNTYTISILNGQYPDEDIAAWIDYNNNGVFDTAELLGTVNAIDSLQPYYITFTTPSVINVTSARLRIRMAWNVTTTVDPCLNFGFGETEDYRIDFVSCPSEPTVNLGNDTTFCGSPFAFNLDAGNAGASYVWQTGLNTQIITADTSGTYVVDVTYPDGCHGRDSISITGIPFITPNAGFSYNATNLIVVFSNSSTNATTYFWTFGDGSSSTLNNPSYTYSATGQYMVTLIASNSCATDTQQFLITITNTGISNLSLKNNSVLVVPNPSNGQLSLMFELINTENVTAEVYNAVGARVVNVGYGKITGKQNLQLDLTALPKGVYMLKLTGDAMNKTQMISIQ